MSASPLVSPALVPPAATAPDTQQPSQSSGVSAAEAKDGASEALKTLKEEFETYRKEKAENEK